MRNILAIAQKELKSYFASPIAYIVIGLFALFYGYFYAVYLQVFLRDSAGDPGVIASVFGPTVDASGKMTQAGGIALLANVRQLITGHAIGAGAHEVTYRPEPLPIVSGPRAAEYEGQYGKLRGLESNLVRAFNSAR